MKERCESIVTHDLLWSLRDHWTFILGTPRVNHLLFIFLIKLNNFFDADHCLIIKIIDNLHYVLFEWNGIIQIIDRKLLVNLLIIYLKHKFQ